jgi:hypothetical protein
MAREAFRLWQPFGRTFRGTHLVGLVAVLTGFATMYVAPDMNMPMWMGLIYIGALGLTAGQVEAGILKRLERLEKAQMTARDPDAAAQHR